MNRFKAFFSSALLLAVMLMPCFSAYADGSDYNDFVINSYDVRIDVSEENILHVTEDINVNFNKQRHGIYRTIPRRFTVMRENGSTSRARIKLKNFKCSEKYDLTSGNDYSIQIGDADKYVIGEHNYQLEYDYVIGMDLLDDADELYFNIIGTEWNTKIKNVTFEINMPKDFDKSKIGFSAGYAGETGTEIVEYAVDGNKITGYTTAALGYSKGLTIRIELPEGYFFFDNDKQNMIAAAIAVIPVLVLIAVFVIWSVFGRDKKVVDIVEFYPPKNTNCVGVAYWYKGMVSGEDVVPLLIELANEGYLVIEEDNLKGYIIRRLKSYDGDDQSKKIFMQGLFKRGDTTYKARLENEFFVYVDKIKLVYNTPDNRKKVFDKNSLMMRMLCWALSIGAAILDLYIYIGTYHTDACKIAVAVGLAVCVVAFILSFLVRKRTDDGHMVLQQIKGFKTFLETAEKERLETLVEENPEYFYDILPYAYVLGVSDKWIKKFESIAIEPPTWCNVDYRGIGYLHFINSTLKNCSSSMQSRPIDTSSGGGSVSGGGFSGGGVSGGGFGGGGGGSW